MVRKSQIVQYCTEQSNGHSLHFTLLASIIIQSGLGAVHVGVPLYSGVSLVIFSPQKEVLTQSGHFLDCLFCPPIRPTLTIAYSQHYPHPRGPLKLRLHESSSNPGSTHFRSRTEFQSTDGCGLSQPQSGSY